MGAGYHGNFGKTYGSDVKVFYKLGSKGESYKNYTKDDLINYIDGITEESTIIATGIKNGSIKVNVLGDKLFENYLGASSNTVAMTVGNQIYLRNSSISIYSDMVHEGTHALDYVRGIEEHVILSWTGEMKAYSAERKFQIAKGDHVDFLDENDMLVHIWKNYKRS